MLKFLPLLIEVANALKDGKINLKEIISFLEALIQILKNLDNDTRRIN